MVNMPNRFSVGGFIPPSKNITAASASRQAMTAQQAVNMQQQQMLANMAQAISPPSNSLVEMPRAWIDELTDALGTPSTPDLFSVHWPLGNDWMLRTQCERWTNGLDFDAAADAAIVIMRNMIKHRMSPVLVTISLLNRPRREELFGPMEARIAEELLLPPDKSWMVKWFNAITSGDYTDVQTDPRTTETLLRAMAAHPYGPKNTLHTFTSPRELIRHVRAEAGAGAFSEIANAMAHAQKQEHLRMMQMMQAPPPNYGIDFAGMTAYPPVRAPGKSLFDFFRKKDPR